MSDLRKSVIRLAASLPKGSEERRLLLSALKEARSNLKKLIEGDQIRVEWSDHPWNSLVVQEMPGKPLKRKLDRLVVETGTLVNYDSSFLMVNVLRDAKLKKSMNFDQAVAAMRKAMEEARERALERNPALVDKFDRNVRWDLTGRTWYFHLSQISWLEVEPADYKPLSFRGRDFGGEAKWDEFKFYADRDEDEYMAYNEGMSAFYTSKSAGGARKLFKLLKADPTAVKNMDLDGFKKLLDRNKIAYQYVPTVWR